MSCRTVHIKNAENWHKNENCNSTTVSSTIRCISYFSFCKRSPGVKENASTRQMENGIKEQHISGWLISLIFGRFVPFFQRFYGLGDDLSDRVTQSLSGTPKPAKNAFICCLLPNQESISEAGSRDHSGKYSPERNGTERIFRNGGKSTKNYYATIDFQPSQSPLLVDLFWRILSELICSCS